MKFAQKTVTCLGCRAPLPKGEATVCKHCRCARACVRGVGGGGVLVCHSGARRQACTCMGVWGGGGMDAFGSNFQRMLATLCWPTHPHVPHTPRICTLAVAVALQGARG
jgi:hypothetical protein